MHLSSHPRDPNLPVTASASRERDPSLPPNGAELPPPPTRPADHTHPASLDNALQLAAACATAASDRSLLVLAAFSAFAAPRANSGVARLRASADVCKGEEAQSQCSNHALLGSSGVLLARVKGLDVRAMRRGTVPAVEPAARQRESNVLGGMFNKQVPSLASAVTDVASIRATVLRNISAVLDDSEVGLQVGTALKAPGIGTRNYEILKSCFKFCSQLQFAPLQQGNLRRQLQPDRGRLRRLLPATSYNVC